MTHDLESDVGVCPVCSAPILTSRSIGGIWSGSVTRKEKSGPMYAAVCGKCATELVACPTYAEADAGRFIWEREHSEENA
jgi:hypothetical protein